MFPLQGIDPKELDVVDNPLELLAVMNNKAKLEVDADNGIAGGRGPPCRGVLLKSVIGGGRGYVIQCQ